MWEACSQGNFPYKSCTSDDDIRQKRLNNETLSRPNSCNNHIWTTSVSVEGQASCNDERYLFETLLCSYPSRLRAVKNANGRHTDY